MRRLTGAVVAALLVGGLGATPASAQTDAVAVARALIDAENRHDVTAAVNLFAPAAIVNLPTGALVGRAEIERWQRDLAAGNFRAEITPPVAVTPEIVTFSGTVALDTFRRLGISSLESTWELTVQLGQVTTFNFNFTPAAGARLQAALGGAGAGGTGATGGGAQAAGGGSAASSAGAGAGGAGGAGAGSGRSLALTGGSPGLAGTGVAAVALGALLLLVTRRRTSP